MKPTYYVIILSALWLISCGFSTDNTDGKDDEVQEPNGWSITPPIAPSWPALPQLPELPRLESWTCPDGWLNRYHEEVTAVDGEPFQWCEPPPIPRLRLDDSVTPLAEGELEEDRPICDPAADGTFPVVGFSDCQPLGEPCPEGLFPQIPLDMRLRSHYVLAGATAGIGTEERPFGTIHEAVEAARSGDVVVIGPGNYVESLEVTKDLTFWGTCVQQTVIEGPNDPSGEGIAALVIPAEVSVTIRNLRVSGALRGIKAWGAVDVEGVWVHATTRQGIACRECSMVLRRVLVTSTAPLRGRWGGGLHVSGSSSEASVQVLDSTFEQNAEITLTVEMREANLDLENVLIRNTRWEELSPGYQRGYGLEVMDEARVTGRRVVVDGAHFFGVSVRNSGTRLDLRDMVVYRTRYELGDTLVPESRLAAALVAQDGANVETRWVLFEENQGTAIINNASNMKLSNIVVRRTHWFTDVSGGGKGFGASILSGNVEMKEGLFEENHERTVHLSANEPTRVVLEDIWIRDTRPSSSFYLIAQGIGANVQEKELEIVLKRGFIEQSYSQGIILKNDLDAPQKLRVRLEDVTVINTNPDDVSQTGIGIWLRQTDATISRALVRESHSAGISVMNSSIDFEDITVEDTSIAEGSDLYICGITLSDRTVGSLDKAHLLNNVDCGLRITNMGTSVDLTNITVRNTTPGFDDSVSYGLLIDDSATANVSRAHIVDNQVFGVSIESADASAHLEDLRIESTQPPRSRFEHAPAGLIAINAPFVEVLRASIQANNTYGIAAVGEDTEVSLEDVEVTETSPHSDTDRLGYGLLVKDGAQVSVLRGRFAANHECGVAAIAAKGLSLRDVLVTETKSSADDGRLGRGLHIEKGGEVELVQSQISGNRDIGVSVLGENTSLSLNQVLIGDTAFRACYELEENDPLLCRSGRGYGLSVTQHGSVTIDDVEIIGSAGLGLQLGDGGMVSGTDLYIYGSPVGANLHECSTDYVLEEAIEGLLIESCDIAIDESEMSIPEELPESRRS